MVKGLAKSERPSHFQLPKQNRQTVHPRLALRCFFAICDELLWNSHGFKAAMTLFKGKYLKCERPGSNFTRLRLLIHGSVPENALVPTSRVFSTLSSTLPYENGKTPPGYFLDALRAVFRVRQ